MPDTALSIAEDELAKRRAELDQAERIYQSAYSSRETAKLRVLDAQAMRERLAALPGAQPDNVVDLKPKPAPARANRGVVIDALRAAAALPDGFDVEQIVTARPDLNEQSVRSAANRMLSKKHLARHPVTFRLHLPGAVALAQIMREPPASPPAPGQGEPVSAPVTE